MDNYGLEVLLWPHTDPFHRTCTTISQLLECCLLTFHSFPFLQNVPTLPLLGSYIPKPRSEWYQWLAYLCSRDQAKPHLQLLALHLPLTYLPSLLPLFLGGLILSHFHKALLL
jgi:hypothetical protein